MDEIDIWRTAQLIAKRHGPEAEFAAARRIDAMIAKGDPAGETAWKRILAAIKELQRLMPRDGERLN